MIKKILGYKKTIALVLVTVLGGLGIALSPDVVAELTEVCGLLVDSAGELSE